MASIKGGTLDSADELNMYAAEETSVRHMYNTHRIYNIIITYYNYILAQIHNKLNIQVPPLHYQKREYSLGPEFHSQL